MEPTEKIPSLMGIFIFVNQTMYTNVGMCRIADVHFLDRYECRSDSEAVRRREELIEFEAESELQDQLAAIAEEYGDEEVVIVLYHPEDYV